MPNITVVHLSGQRASPSTIGMSVPTGLLDILVTRHHGRRTLPFSKGQDGSWFSFLIIPCIPLSEYYSPSCTSLLGPTLVSPPLHSYGIYFPKTHSGDSSSCLSPRTTRMSLLLIKMTSAPLTIQAMVMMSTWSCKGPSVLRGARRGRRKTTSLRSRRFYPSRSLPISDP